MEPKKSGVEPFPTGKEPFPNGKERLPKGKERFPDGKERLPKGKERLPKGKERLPKGKERLPTGKESPSPRTNRPPNPRNRRFSRPGLRNPRNRRFYGNAFFAMETWKRGAELLAMVSGLLRFCGAISVHVIATLVQRWSPHNSTDMMMKCRVGLLRESGLSFVNWTTGKRSRRTTSHSSPRAVCSAPRGWERLMSLRVWPNWSAHRVRTFGGTVLQLLHRAQTGSHRDSQQLLPSFLMMR